MTDTASGEVTAEKKFYKTNFDEIIKSDEWSEAVDILIESAMFKKLGSIEGVDIDSDSYEEIKSLSQELDLDFDV